MLVPARERRAKLAVIAIPIGWPTTQRENRKCARSTYALLVVALGSSTVAYAQDRVPQQGNLFSGTPEEQAACSPDATKFCQKDFPDTFAVLACLQKNRQQLRKACLQVLESHGQ